MKNKEEKEKEEEKEEEEEINENKQKVKEPNMNRSDQFKSKPTINPKTKTPVKIGSEEYKKLEERYGEPNKIKSPKTSKKISVNKGEYKKLIKEGYTDDELLYGIKIQEEKDKQNENKNYITAKQLISTILLNEDTEKQY
jgi:hypothetical protein